ncbi:hypothetical protein [Sphingobium sp. SA916]|uniref:hypothetical protein n=1 Tax=Sphingobium sp. SA916 TaxID=1851207 RepID=UPI000C9EF855|nr:hypothetical protein [Sphingobium sp. SA916]PNQ04034.1 hypothetical protein A8G00_09160 [Sphingobium sp. SA916]
MATTPDSTRLFMVRIQYFSAGECFASETMEVEVPDGGDVSAAVHAAAQASTYHDVRIPELSFTVEFIAPGPDDPDLAPLAGRLKPVCSHCGSDSIVRDAAVRWDVESQQWEVSGIYDCTTCDLCGAESDDLATWVPAEQVTPPEQFEIDLAARIGTPELRSDSTFQQFCFGLFLTHSVDAAAAAWLASDHSVPR